MRFFILIRRFSRLDRACGLENASGSSSAGLIKLLSLDISASSRLYCPRKKGAHRPREAKGVSGAGAGGPRRWIPWI